MIENIKVRLQHFAKDRELKIESTPCIQHSIMFTVEKPFVGHHQKMEYKTYVRKFLEDLFNEDFFLYEVEIEGKQTVVVTIVDIRTKMDIETGKEVVSHVSNWCKKS